MDKVIIRFYLIRGENAKIKRWQKVKIKVEEGMWNGIVVKRFIIPEFYYRGKDWNEKKLHEILNQQLEMLVNVDFEYVPYSLFRNKIGVNWENEPRVELASELIWQKIIKKFPNYYGIIIRDGAGFHYHELLREKAIRLKYIGVVGNQYNQKCRELEEDIYEEFGLWMLCANCIEELCCSFKEPVLILDASQDKIQSLDHIIDHSIWIDLCSDNKKRGKIEKRYPKIEYISLKKELEQVRYLDSEERKRL